MTAESDWASYFFPDTFQPEYGYGILRNLLNLRDHALLDLEECRYNHARRQQLQQGWVQIPKTFDAAMLKAIHQHLFQDIYDWAGEYRIVNMAKGGGLAFSHFDQIDQYLADAARIIQLTNWKTLNQEQFAERTAEIFAYVNHAHPFREGNGRASKWFMVEVAKLSPFRLEFSGIPPRIWNQASALSGPDLGKYHPDPESLIPVFEFAIR